MRVVDFFFFFFFLRKRVVDLDPRLWTEGMIKDGMSFIMVWK